MPWVKMVTIVHWAHTFRSAPVKCTAESLLCSSWNRAVESCDWFCFVLYCLCFVLLPFFHFCLPTSWRLTCWHAGSTGHATTHKLATHVLACRINRTCDNFFAMVAHQAIELLRVLPNVLAPLHQSHCGWAWWASHQEECGTWLDAPQGAVVLQLFVAKDEPLLFCWNSFLVLDFVLDNFDDIQFDIHF